MQLVGIRVGYAGIECKAHGLYLVIDFGGLDMAFHRFFDPPCDPHRHDDDGQYGNDEGRQFGGEQAVFEKEFSHAFLLLCECISAPGLHADAAPRRAGDLRRGYGDV